METEKLIHMANQIGAYFAAEPDVEAGRAGVAQHLAKFWAPPMRRTLMEHYDAHGDAGLMPIVGEALKTHRQLLLGKAE